MVKKQLKGGSLSSTYLINNNFVRKTVSLTQNREYGFQRWYSQLKRIQRYEVLFPGLFPKLLNYGMGEKEAYFDIEYIPNSCNGFEFLSQTQNLHQIEEFIESLTHSLSYLHSHSFTSDANSIKLYLREEIDQRIEDCLKNSTFNKFTQYDTIIFQEEEIPSFLSQINKYKKIALKGSLNIHECFTHGNLTLENIIYQPLTKAIYFIDPYEENIIDSPLAEYSQLLQSSNSLYELYNSSSIQISKNSLTSKVVPPIGLVYFNNWLLTLLNKKYSTEEITLIKVLEISQFIRMLPFKASIDEDKMLFFYGLASKLLNDLIK